MAIAFASSVPARAQNWNLYGGYNSLPAISFAYGPMSTNNGASVMMTMTGANPTPFVMDTGSTGILVSPDNFKPGPNDVAVGTGSQFYSSSGLLSTGTFYVTDVAINNTATAGTPGPNGTQPIAGAALATARVTVLLVTNQICTIPGRNCTPSSSPTGVAYMGVGFDRGSSSITPPAAFNNTNPFINIVSLASGAPISTLRPGYLITNGGVTLGLSNTADVNNNNPGSNFAFVKLTPNTANSGQPAPAWQQAPMAISVGGVSGSGAILPDAGINYSYLTPPPNAVLQTISCPASVGSGNCINPASGAQVQVFLPGQSTTQPASFSYTLGTAGNPMNPNDNVQVIPDGAIFLNTGRQFYQGIDYIYDPIGGFVGYAWASTTNGAIGQVTPSLSLIGSVALQDGFANSLPTFLMGGTTLLQTGTGSITSVISGAGGLTIGSGQVNLTGANIYFGGTTVTGGATLGINADSALGDLSGGLTLNNGTLLAGADITTARAVALGAGSGMFNTNGFNIVLGSAVTGVGGLIKNGLGVLTLEGANSYTGGTTVAAGTLDLTGSMIGSLSILAGATFTTTGGWALASGAFFNNAGTFQSLGGGPLVNQGMLVNNGTMTTDLVNSGRLSGIGTITGTVAGYGYNDNQMTRQIVLPNLAARIAQGRTGANQLLGQAEAGYRIAIYEPAAASLTPFARVQATTVSQMGFSENGAASLNLNVAPQTTGSARSVLGAELASAFGAEGREKLAMQLRLGWAHEYANTARPVTANFAGAPGANFTVFGAAPQRDAATVSLAANTAIAAGTSLYLRYDGEMGTGTNSHSLNGGLRVTW